MADDGGSTPEKVCKKCGVLRSLAEYGKCRKARDGRVGKCNICVNERRREVMAERPDRRASQALRHKRWKAENRDHHLALKRAECERRRRRLGMKAKSDIRVEALARRDAARVDRKRALAEQKQQRLAARPWTDPSLSAAQSFALQYKLNPEFNLKERLRAHLRRKRQGIKLGDLIRSALGRNGRSPRVEEFLGYSIDDLRRHIERQFANGMNWQRFCAGDIHIDHRIALTNYDLSQPKELKAAWALPNLQPLWAADNRAKAARRTVLV